MTYNGPFTEATLLYEQNENESILINNPDTLSDFIFNNFPNYWKIIKSANLLPLFNSLEGKYTIFIPHYINLNNKTCYNICKKFTIPGIITTDLLSSSPSLSIYNLNKDYINVTTDYFTNIIKIENNILLKGDIICKNGIIHIIDGIL